MSSKKLWQGVVAVTVLMVAAAASADDHGNRNRIVQPGEVFFDKSYDELVSKWTNWLVVEPTATNPAFDPDGRFCGKNQEGKIWFLASTFAGVADRTCEIPAGKAIFVSLGGAVLSFSPEFPEAGNPCLQMATAVDKVRCDINNGLAGAPDTTLEVTLDGVPVEDVFAYRAQNQPGGFTVRIRNHSLLNDFGFAPGNRFPAMLEGYFLFLKPLRRGTHTLNLLMTEPNQAPKGVNYTLIIGDDD